MALQTFRISALIQTMQIIVGMLKPSVCVCFFFGGGGEKGVLNMTYKYIKKQR